MAESLNQGKCGCPPQDQVELTKFVGHRIIVHKDSESRLVGNLREITPKKTLLLTETFKQKVDGAIEVLGKIEVPPNQFKLVCLYTKCQCPKPAKPLDTEKE